MKESLEAIRSLHLAPVFEDMYFGKKVPANLWIYLRYPEEFHWTKPSAWNPLTAGGLIPIVDDGNFYDICFYDSLRHKFVVKFIEEPDRTVIEFDSWQQFLAYTLLKIADSGPTEAHLTDVAQAVGFERTPALLALLRECETLADSVIDERCDQFIREG